MIVLQGRTWKVFISLSSSGVPVTGVLPGDVTYAFMRQADTSLQTKTLTATEWAEVGNGLYTLVISSDETAQIGGLYLSLAGGSFDAVTLNADVHPNPVSPVEPEKCVVSGNILDVGGNPERNLDVRFRIVKLPATTSAALIGGGPIHTRPDAYGTFSAALLRGAIVLVEIPGAALRHQITIPDQETASLLDLLPPIDNNP